jgi:cystathionine beta-lyase/cystathionine gamma-synthase
VKRDYMLKDTSIYTQAVHAEGRRVASDFMSVSTPIYNSSTYFYESMDDLDAVFAGTKKGYVYTRHGNPTNRALEKALAVLEGGKAAYTFSSGMAAIHAALLATGLKKGDHIVAAQDLYGSTYALLTTLFKDLGIHTHFVDITDLEQVEAVISRTVPKTLIFEVISNPLLKVANVPGIIDVAHIHNMKVVVDSTFTTPYLIKPLQYGADFIIHSVTKYINGHGDVLGGAVICPEEKTRLEEVTKLLGATLGPNEAFLALRGLKTLPLRMARHCENAMKVANYLCGHSRIQKVFYPGLSSHPQHTLASKIFRRNCYGGMVSFEIKDAGQKGIFTFFESLNLLLPATSLGDIHSLVLYPAHTSHRLLTSQQRERIGITDGLVRLSVGIEDPADIIADLEQALQSI